MINKIILIKYINNSPISAKFQGTPTRIKTYKGCFSDHASTPISKLRNNKEYSVLYNSLFRFSSTDELICTK